MRLRTGTLAEVETVRALEKAARIRYRTIPKLAFVASAAPIAAERLRSGMLAVVEDGGAFLGFTLTDIVDDRLHVANISVHPEASGRGVGAALIEDVLAKAAARGLDVTLTTFRQPAWNAPWFARFGFVAMPGDAIGPGLRRIQQRQATSIDPATRITLWRPAAAEVTES
jgi:GNAT superfamily N-acetyltransferase